MYERTHTTIALPGNPQTTDTGTAEWTAVREAAGETLALLRIEQSSPPGPTASTTCSVSIDATPPAYPRYVFVRTDEAPCALSSDCGVVPYDDFDSEAFVLFTADAQTEMVVVGGVSYPDRQ